ncbi:MULTISPECIES: MAPEG family protein [Actibacterium]|uniref:Inner membrane protein YecN n=1 Tax=Actibacterium naphthalenivorans TaxID=1614693 RepID=A0A840C4U5_9RHOB|nr:MULTISPECIES: MAPEG family protein [Actibacterium]ALG89811.1 membrane-associated proteins in eicosanoid and glutathione metabolism [Actibacterium sp. EMB200-NS6]MBB4020475.1 hypothetical protein [Actibacterium naphthalenivorans]
MLTIAPLYAGLITLLFVALSVRVILRRREAGVSLGDGDDNELRKRIRAQGNCAEYAPLGLILLGMAEVQGAPVWALHLLGLMLLAGRALHAWAVSRTPSAMRARVGGMTLTFVMLILGALANIGQALF